MLKELRIENLLLIESAQLHFADGLNVITGETGAGKTMLAHAIDLLLGGRSKKGIVRPGASEAYVEGLLQLPPGLLEGAEFSDLAERLADPENGEIAVGRRVSPEGRTRAYVEGRAATAADLKLLGGALVSFYGQHEHRKLTLAGAQLATLDSFAAGAVDAEHPRRLDELSGLHAEARALTGSLAELELVDGRRERELGLIEFELAEIDDFEPDPAEETALASERDRLRAVDRLRVAGQQALDVLDGENPESTGGSGAAPLLAAATAALQGADGADPELTALADRADALTLELADLGAELRAYIATLSADPPRLALLDDRLDGYERLKRKHGGNIESVLQHAARCREDRERLAGAGEQIEESAALLEQTRLRQRELSTSVSKARRKAAPRLATSVRERLAGLALEGASFEIKISDSDGAVGPSGSDEIEFMIAPNPGIAPAPLREIASGGELSRVMLALLTAGTENGHGAGGRQALVFDEVDAGIGGHTARAVGQRLRELGGSHQVICITHLPQVAATAERHFQIAKESVIVDDAEASVTNIHQLEGTAVVEELCRMLGADADDGGARRHAEELLAQAL
jgi:DNA repair protein RecN (Recombination protein N)